jgi:hypothetical protein
VNDQILFWDTDTNATVSLSKNEKELRQKIIASTLSGGHLVIRPAELFEGKDFYFDDAVKEDGFLFNLMKNGAASLALDKGSSLCERANWRFRDGTVFDRGTRYTEKKDIEIIRKRTETRAEKIEAVGWGNCPLQANRAKDVFEKDLNLRIRYLLSKVSNVYFENGIEENKAINSFINGSVQVASRSDIYDVVKTVWVDGVDDSKKANFVSDCSSALTLAAISNTADNYGDRISEVKGQNYNSLSTYSSLSGISAAKVETTVLKSFLRVLPSKMERLESEQKHFAGMALNLEANQFAEASTSIITSRDRDELNLLLYGESEYLDNLSLTEYIYLEWGRFKSKDIDRLVEIRVDELSKVYGKDTGRSGVLLSMMRSCAVEAILLKIGAPFVPTLINALKDLRDSNSSIRPIFSGFRTKI